MVRRTASFLAVVAIAAYAAPTALSAQAHDDHAGGHSHAGAPVDCATLATPPWTGLSVLDREIFEEARRAVAHLDTPEEAIAAGFRPALGDIPGMGTHYVSSERMNDGVKADQPDHLLFSEVDGREVLVGSAYAFTDVPDTKVQIPFDSDLAMWHDHPQFADPGETLHMLHMWYVPSSNGPFAGLNFWLPYHNAGVTPPSACWMADDMERIQTVSFALVKPRGEDAQAAYHQRMEARSGLIGALDAAARAEDHHAWMEAADAFLGDLSDQETMMVNMLLRALTDAQMSTQQRNARGG